MPTTDPAVIPLHLDRAFANGRDLAAPAAAGARGSVTLVATSGEFGGMERLVCHLARALGECGWGAERPLFPAMTDAARVEGLCADLGLAPQFLPADVLDVTRMARGRRPFTVARDILRADAPDIVHLHYPESFLSLKHVLAARRAGSVCVAHLHGVTDWKRAGRDKRVRTRLAARLCHRVLVNSSATRRSALAGGVPASLIETVAGGAPAPSGDPPSRAEACCRLGLPPDAFVIASAGRLVAQKRIGDVVRAAALLPPDGGPAPVLVVAGDGPARAGIEAEAAKPGAPRVVLLGYRSDLEDLYAAADVFALPSEGEAFGLVYVEAALRGLPSVGADGGGVPDVIRDGETGLLVPTGDVAALADRLDRLRRDPALRKRLGEAARAESEGRFTLDAVAVRVGALYGELLGRSRGGRGRW
jgi:2-deoxystreptamine N-acetyl-D-glucosaminyltransferase/2-deoxystreptamine glucosyltransferase